MLDLIVSIFISSNANNVRRGLFKYLISIYLHIKYLKEKSFERTFIFKVMSSLEHIPTSNICFYMLIFIH